MLQRNTKSKFQSVVLKALEFSFTCTSCVHVKKKKVRLIKLSIELFFLIYGNKH